MSEKLDLVRSIYADWERGDWSRPLTDASRVTGVAAMAMTWTEFLSTWDDFRAEAHEYREIDDEHIVVYVHNTGRGKGSGMEVGQVMGTEDGANLFVIRDGKVVKLVLYRDRNRALADLGLEA